jgi:hypothetical protein
MSGLWRAELSSLTSCSGDCHAAVIFAKGLSKHSTKMVFFSMGLEDNGQDIALQRKRRESMGRDRKPTLQKRCIYHMDPSPLSP